MKMLDALDLQLNQLQNFVVQVLAADPANTEARLYYNSVSHTLRYYNGTAWTDLAAASYTDEQAQDAVAAMLAAGSNTVVTATYNDAGNSMTLGIGAGQVTLAMVASQAANTVVANTTGSAASPTAVTLASFKTWLAVVPGDVTGFDTQVRTNRLDQMAAPTASVSLNSQKLTSVLDPTAAQDAATKAYVDALSQGLAPKESVRAATSAAGTLASSFANGSAIDGVTLATGDRILIKDQAAPAENGIYTVNASGAPTRALDADSSNDLRGATVWVEEGTVNADQGWVLTTNAPITVGTTGLSWTQNSGLGQIAVTAPIVKTGNTLSLDTSSTTHVARVWSGALTGGATSEVVTHNLGTRDVQLQVLNNATPWDAVLVTWEATSTNTVTIRSGAANLPASYRVVVMG